MKLSRRLIFAGLAVLIPLAGAVAFFQPQRQEPIASPSPYIATARGQVDVDGGTIQLSASRDGIISAVLVEEGAKVKKDQLLAVLDSRQAILQQEQAKALIAKLEAQLPATQLKLAAAKRERRRQEALVGNGALPRQNLDQALDNENQTNEEINLILANIKEAQATLKVAEQEIEQRTVRAPLDGAIVRSMARPGAGASTTNTSVLFWFLPDTARMVRAELEERFIACVKPGMAADIILEADPSASSRGKVVRVGKIFGPKRPVTDDPAERQDERVVECLLDIDNQDLLVGQRVLVKFRRAE